MAEVTPRTSQDMPMWARLLATIIALGLLLIGLAAFFVVRPLTWQLAVLSLGSIGLGADLLYGAFRGQWPISALIWLVP